jgi:hypothetical protein
MNEKFFFLIEFKKLNKFRNFFFLEISLNFVLINYLKGKLFLLKSFFFFL